MKEFKKSNYATVRNSEFKFFVRSAGHFLLTQPDYWSLHSKASFGELFWGIAGTGRFVLDGREYLLNPGYVWYYPPGSEHKFFPADDFFEYRWMTIGGPEAQLLFDGLALRPGMHYAGKCPEELFAQLQLIIESPERNQRLASISLGVSILTLASSRKKSRQARKNCAELARAIIDKDFADPALTVEHLADILDVNRVSLSRRFDSHYGITISAYLRQRRLQTAFKYLRETELSIAEISSLCGFSAVSYFIRCMRKTFGKSPGKIRRSQDS